MKINRIIALILAFIMLGMVACEKNDGAKLPDREESADRGENEENGGIKNSAIKLEGNEVVYRGKVTNLGNSQELEMEIVDSTIAFGLYRVLISGETTFYGLDGEEINRETIEIGDVIEVVFSGQVMMSYPPQIAARRVYIAE